MSSQQPTVTVQLSGVELFGGPPMRVMSEVHVFIVQSAPHGYILVIKPSGPLQTPIPLAVRDPSVPPEAVYVSIINEELQAVLDVEHLNVEISTGRSLMNPFGSPFRMSFAKEIDFWRFCGAMSEAKVAQVLRAAKLAEVHREAVNRLLEDLKVEAATA